MPTCSRQTLVKDHAFLVKPAYYLKSLYGVRGFGRLPYEDLAPKAFMKTSFQRIFDPESSQGNRNGYYPKLRKTLDFPASIT